MTRCPGYPSFLTSARSDRCELERAQPGDPSKAYPATAARRYSPAHARPASSSWRSRPSPGPFDAASEPRAPQPSKERSRTAPHSNRRVPHRPARRALLVPDRPIRSCLQFPRPVSCSLPHIGPISESPLHSARLAGNQRTIWLAVRLERHLSAWHVRAVCPIRARLHSAA